MHGFLRTSAVPLRRRVCCSFFIFLCGYVNSLVCLTRCRLFRCGSIFRHHAIRFYGTVEDADMSCRNMLHLVKTVSDHDEELILRNLPEEFDDLLGRLGIEVAGRLVGQNDRAVLRQGSRDNRSLFLSA